MAHWNYRILASEHKGEMSLGIYEVYYDDKGMPSSHTKNIVGVISECGDGVGAFLWQLDNIMKALKKPVLYYDEKFPKEYCPALLPDDTSGKDIENLARECLKNEPDEGLFPNHSGEDIYIKGFVAGYSSKIK